MGIDFYGARKYENKDFREIEKKLQEKLGF